MQNFVSTFGANLVVIASGAKILGAVLGRNSYVHHEREILTIASALNSYEHPQREILMSAFGVKSLSTSSAQNSYKPVGTNSL